MTTTFDRDTITPMDTLTTQLVHDMQDALVWQIRTHGHDLAEARTIVLDQAERAIAQARLAFDDDLAHDETIQRRIASAREFHEDMMRAQSQLETYIAIVAVTTSDPYERIDPELHDAYVVWQQQGPVTLLACQVYAVSTDDAHRQITQATGSSLIVVVDEQSPTGQDVALLLQGGVE